MTDARFICDWLEPNHAELSVDELGWHGVRYRANNLEYCERLLTLDALREVEERLSYEQRGVYVRQLLVRTPWATNNIDAEWALVNATAEAKIAAIAAVLRESPESAERDGAE